LIRKTKYESCPRIKSATGEYRYFLSYAVPIFNKENSFIHYQGFSLDITEQKLNEDALRDKQKKIIEANSNLEKLSDKLHKNLIETVFTLSAAVEYRDAYTVGHSKNVARLACAIGGQMGLQAERIEALELAGLLHYIGKIAIPLEILEKISKLTEEEFELIKEHSHVGYELLKNIDFDLPIARIVLEHHERINGSGYPNGKGENELLLESKILAVADVVDAMTLPRPYKEASGIESALAEIELKSGIEFDIDVVKACIKLFKEKGFALIPSSQTAFWSTN
jgi:putative nucleotidyltransferase with HDIG domain